MKKKIQLPVIISRIDYFISKSISTPAPEILNKSQNLVKNLKMAEISTNFSKKMHIFPDYWEGPKSFLGDIPSIYVTPQKKLA